MAVRVILCLALFTGLCFAQYTENLALNAVAVQSSLGHPQGDPQHAVDGNRDSNYAMGSCTHTKGEFNPWWRVDLGKVYTVSKVTITSRQDCCQERLRGFQIRIGNSLDNNGNNNELAVAILTVIDGGETFSFKSIKGRYVNIFLPGNDKILTLCEVEVFGVRDTSAYICVQRNFALNGVAVQSSLGHPQGDPQHAVDGNRDSNYAMESCTHTKGEFNPWWRVDLGNVYDVSKVNITSRQDCCQERLRGFQIRIGNNLDNNGNNNELAATILTVIDGTETFSFGSISGRYVNIFLPGNDKIITLCEVEVFGE